MTVSPTLIVGIGSSHGDDQAGWCLVQHLTALVTHEQVCLRQAASPAELLDWLDGVEQLVICDACRADGHAGKWHCWSWPFSEFADTQWSGTHDLSLPAVLTLAARLRRLPRQVTVWGIEGSTSDAAASMSAEVSAAIPEVAKMIWSRLEADLSASEAAMSNS